MTPAKQPRRLRLDAELVRRGQARSREQARILIEGGQVRVNGLTALKPATAVAVDADVVVRTDPGQVEFASRGGHKLASALRDFGALDDQRPRPEIGVHRLVVRGRRCLDAGASTGGFTDVLLRAGAREVVAVDVGYGQLRWELRQDPRVVVRDRTNVRTLSLEDTAGPVDLVVGDLSFISLELVLDALIGVTRPDGDLVLMIKPQFEVGRERLGKGGVVREPEHRAWAVERVLAAAYQRGWGARGLTVSDLPGPSGNVEFFAWLRRDAPPADAETVRDVVRRPPGAPAEPGEPDERLSP